MHGRRTKSVAAVLALAMAATMLAACAATPDAAEPAAPARSAASWPVTITDDASRTVTIESEPKRIVSLAPANTEIVYSLGLFDRLVGVTTYDDYPARVKSVAKVGDFAAPNIEAVAAARPDVILATGGVQADVIAKLEGIGAKVIVVDPKDVDAVLAAITTVSRALGAKDKGAQVVASMKADLADVASRLGTAQPVTAFIEIGWNPLFTAGKGSLLDDLLTRAGGKNVVTQKHYVGYSVEQLVKDQPAVYLGTKSSIGDPLTLESRPGYAALWAIENGSVYTLDDNLVSRPGPRVVLGVREIAKALHPDLFK